jgi:pyruvate dehydrogenase E1 component alpha subunit
MKKDQAFSLYKQMLRIRRFEEELFHLFMKRPISGSMRQYIGEEAVAAGVLSEGTRPGSGREAAESSARKSEN